MITKEDLDLLIESTRSNQEVSTLAMVLASDYSECITSFVPIEYEKKYGIRIESALSLLLETYHQLRLQDETNK